METKGIIDYAMDDNGVEFRNSLYSSIQDKVNAHIEAKKVEIAQGLIAQPEIESQVETETEEEETGENS
jgi:uncharacterized Rossmann fold enzyme